MDMFTLTHYRGKSFWYSARPRNNFPNYHKYIVPAAVIGTATIAIAASSPPPIPPPGTIAAFFQHSAEKITRGDSDI